jgi:small nuclear ribonucleoprotein (snRNP)-like protein
VLKNFRREAKCLLERQVVVDTTNHSYEGRLRAVERDYITLCVMSDSHNYWDQIIIRIEEIVAISTI